MFSYEICLFFTAKRTQCELCSLAGATPFNNLPAYETETETKIDAFINLKDKQIWLAGITVSLKVITMPF
jgi:hypothetical protein